MAIIAVIWSVLGRAVGLGRNLGRQQIATAVTGRQIGRQIATGGTAAARGLVGAVVAAADPGALHGPVGLVAAVLRRPKKMEFEY